MFTGHLSELFVSFQGEGAYAGRRQLFIRMGGCNLRCRYCDTPDSLERMSVFRIQQTGLTREVANPVTIDELLSLATSLLSQEGPVDGVAVTGGEPLLQAPFIAELLKIDSLPRPRLLETSGMLPRQLQLVLPWLDVVSMDIKLPSNSGEPAFWDEHAEFLSRARGKAYVKILIDAQTALNDIERAAALVYEVAPESSVFLQPIVDPRGMTDLLPHQLSTLFNVTRSYVEDVRVLPQIHKFMGIP